MEDIRKENLQGEQGKDDDVLCPEDIFAKGAAEEAAREEALNTDELMEEATEEPVPEEEVPVNDGEALNTEELAEELFEEPVPEEKISESEDILLEDAERGEDEEEEIPEKPDYEQELIDILNSGDSVEQIREQMEDYHENDIASVLDKLTSQSRMRLYQILGLERTADVLSYLDEDNIAAYIGELDPATAARILEKMDSDDAVDLLEELDEEKSEEIQRMMNAEAREDIDLIQSYDEDQIGSRMTTNFISIPKGSTIRSAMRSMISQAAENDNISTLYVVDEENKFYGAIDLKDLIIARDYVNLEDLISTSYPYVYDRESVEECIEKLKDYSEDSIPVLDSENHILGVLTSWDVVEAVDEEMGDDYAKMAGLTEEEDLKEPLKESLRKRLPWLVILLFLGLIVSSVVGLFEPIVAQLTIIVSFQSVILGMSGNVGTQSLGVTIRVLMDENLTGKQVRHLIGKETRVGLINGLLVCAASFVLVGLYLMAAKGKSPAFAFAVSGCIGIALVISMMVSSFCGTIIPVIFKKVGVDPAVASGPLISTINDLTAVISYYGLAWILLINILQLVE